MEKENKKATASEKLTKVVAIRISQTDYDIFLEKASTLNTLFAFAVISSWRSSL